MSINIADLVLFAKSMKPPSRTSCWNYKIASVDRIIDGDTIDITINLGFDLSIKQRVRVAGVDTPEKRTSDHEVEKPLGEDATYWLQSQLDTAAAAGYSTGARVDAGAVLPVYWAGGSDPSTGASSGLDVYTYQAIKTASATFTILGNLTNFA